MRNLVVFLFRHYFFLLFLALEAVSVSMLVRNNYFHRSSLINSANKVTGSLMSARDNMVDYFGLREKNAQLAQQNARLLSERKSSYMMFTGSTIKVNDTIYKQQYSYITAKVIDNSVSLRNNILTLNRGSSDGIQPDMGVIGPNGVIGIVRDVSENFCTVMSMLHSKTQVSTKLKTDGTFGPVNWDGADYRYATLSDLPSHAKLHKGDTLLTTGFGKAFPEGVTVGYVETFSIPSGQNFYTVKLRLATDFKSIDYVYVVRDLMREQREAVQKKTQEEDAK